MKVEGQWTIILVVVCLIVGGVLGWNLKPDKTPKTTITERTTSDSSKTQRHFEDSQTNIIKPKIIPIRKDTISSTDTTKLKLEQHYKTYADSVEGKNEGLGYKFAYKVIDSAGIVVSRMREKFDWTEIKIREQKLKDSVQVVVNTEYIPKPFFLDVWFYVAVAEFALGATVIILSLIF